MSKTSGEEPQRQDIIALVQRRITGVAMSESGYFKIYLDNRTFLQVRPEHLFDNQGMMFTFAVEGIS